MRNGGRPARAERKIRDEIEPSSGNVFADLELPDPEELLARAELVRRVSETIAEHGLTEATAAETLGIDQPTVSALLRGKLDGFSTDGLFRFLNALGRDVVIVVRPAQDLGHQASTRVTTATELLP